MTPDKQRAIWAIYGANRLQSLDHDAAVVGCNTD
jgi:hypothetical protein